VSIPEIQQTVSELSKEELSRFAAWFEEFMADRWDPQIEADTAAGKLDTLFAKADEDIKAGRFTPL
jgi:hypothetical protein